MKKSTWCILIILINLACIAGTSARLSAGVNIGGIVWYGWWESDYLKKIMSNRADPQTVYGTYRINSAPLYGPILSVSFLNKWNLGFVFACGNHFRTRGVGLVAGPAYNGNFTYQKRSAVIFKYDLDATLSFSVHRFVRLFAGMKLQGYNADAPTRIVNPVSYIRSRKNEFSVLGYGPGIGIGVAIPLADRIFLLWNISGIYLRTNDLVATEMYGITINAWYEKSRYDIVLNVFGASTNLSLAYQVPASPVTLGIGFRYQMLNHRMVTARSDYINSDLNPGIIYGVVIINRLLGRRTMNNTYDHFYGLVFTVTCAIEFNSAKDG